MIEPLIEGIDLDKRPKYRQLGYFTDFEHIPYESIDQMFQYCYDPFDVLMVFIKNRVGWGSDTDNWLDKIILLPNEVFKLGVANCLENSIFMRHYCNTKKYKSTICLIYYLNTVSLDAQHAAHAVPLFQSKRNSQVYLWNYYDIGKGGVYGPFKNFEEAKNVIHHYFRLLHGDRNFRDISEFEKAIDKKDFPIKTFAELYTSSDLYKVDRMIDMNKKITQNELLLESAAMLLSQAEEYKERIIKNRKNLMYDLDYQSTKLNFSSKPKPTKNNLKLFENVMRQYKINSKIY